MKNSNQHIGLFGGTFDPVHMGHLKAAQEIKRAFPLDYIHFVPAYIPPHKTHLGPTSSTHRLEMLKKALTLYPDFSIAEYELNKKGISYTIDTIRYYKKTLLPESQLYWILGSDAFLGIHTWKEPHEIFANSHVIVIHRPGYSLESHSILSKWPKLFITLEEGKKYQHSSGHIVFIFDLDVIDISSSKLRQKIARGEPFSSFVTPEVEDYIRANNLYAENEKKS